MLSCPKVAELYATHPERVLDPVDELQRFKTEEGSVEAKEELRQERLATRFADLDERRLLQSDRWNPPSLLE
jgi:hypothetical protein